MEAQTDSMKSSATRTALITGASSGIGRELAGLFAQDGHALILVARNTEKLSQLAEELRKTHRIHTEIISQDLSTTASAQKIFEQLKEKEITVEFLVNNAGFGVYGQFRSTDIRRELDMIQVHVAALTHLTKLFLPAMLKQQFGRILNVASTAAFVPGPLEAVYFASKAYVLSLSLALSEELKHTHVTVTALCPGPTTTDFVRRAGIGKTRLFRSGSHVMSAEKVAKIGYRAMQKAKPVVIPGAFNKLQIFSTRFAPRPLTAKITRKLLECE